jgi:hypothetical protein
MIRGFTYLATPTAETAAFVQVIILKNNIYDIKVTPVYDQKDGVWCAISRIRIISPIGFDGTISSEVYCELILYLLTYGAEPFLKSCQLCNHFPGIYGTRRIITVFTRALSSTRLIQSIPFHPV